MGIGTLLGIWMIAVGIALATGGWWILWFPASLCAIVVIDVLHNLWVNRMEDR